MVTWVKMLVLELEVEGHILDMVGEHWQDVPQD